jgi:large repetitive protein
MGVVGRTCVCIGVCGALVLSLLSTSSPASAQSALLDALSTRVTLAHPGGDANEVANEQIIRSGDTVATDSTGRAVVTYPDGSTALLEESSSLTIEFVRTSAGDYAVRMQQTLGRVWYAVTRAVTLGSRYEVRTAGMASVIRAGSDSYVVVAPDGETTVVTIAGTVDTSAGGAEVSVSAGSSTTVSAPGATPSSPTPAPSTPSSAFTPTSASASSLAPAQTPPLSPKNSSAPAVTTLPPHR